MIPRILHDEAGARAKFNEWRDWMLAHVLYDAPGEGLGIWGEPLDALRAVMAPWITPGTSLLIQPDYLEETRTYRVHARVKWPTLKYLDCSDGVREARMVSDGLVIAGGVAWDSEELKAAGSEWGEHFFSGAGITYVEPYDDSALEIPESDPRRMSAAQFGRYMRRRRMDRLLAAITARDVALTGVKGVS